MKTALALSTALAFWLGPLVPHIGHECECAKRELRAETSCCVKKKAKQPRQAKQSPTSTRDHARSPCGCCPKGEMSAGDATSTTPSAPPVAHAPARLALAAVLIAPPTMSSPRALLGARGPPGKRSIPILHSALLL